MHAYADRHASARDRAFERLYRRYVKDVYRYTLALLRNPADAEDITQTTFLNAYRAYQRGEEPLKPQNWLIKIAHNACRTRYVRASRRPHEVPLEESLRELSVPADEIPNVKEVLDALARLPFNQRAALVMRELEGRSYTEIAQALEVSVPAVETLIFRARRTLRVRRSALKTLVALPLPGSLSSSSAGGVALGGGGLVGSGVLLKAALAVGVGIVAGGVGTAVEAKILSPRVDPVSVPHTAAAAVGTGQAGAAALPSRGPGATVVLARRGADLEARALAGQKGRRAPSELGRRGAPVAVSGTARTTGNVSAPARSAAPQSSLPVTPPSPPASALETVEKTVPKPAVAAPSVPPATVPVAPLPPPVVPPVAPPALPPPPPLPPPPALP